MTTILSSVEICSILDGIPVSQLLKVQEEGFVAYSTGLTMVPPVQYLGFEDPRGDVHIKTGYIRGDDIFVTKMASGFYENAKLGLPTGNGLMIAVNAKNGVPEAILLDADLTGLAVQDIQIAKAVIMSDGK